MESLTTNMSFKPFSNKIMNKKTKLLSNEFLEIDDMVRLSNV